MPSNHHTLCCPLILLSSIFPSIWVFSHDSVLCIRWPRYWSFSFSISPFSEYSGLISFRIDWFDLFAMQGTLKTTVQKHQFFEAQLSSVKLSRPYMTTGKTIALTRQTFASKLMSLLFILFFKFFFHLFLLVEG